MLALPNGRLGQAIALAAALLVVAVIWLAAAAPLLTWYGDRAAALSEQRLLAQRMAGLAAMLPSLQAQTARANAGTAADALLQGDGDAVAGAALQQRAQDMAGRVGIVMTSVETLPPQQEGRYRRIRLRVSLEAPWPQLVRLLTSIEQARPRMLIDELHLEASPLLVHPSGLPLTASFTILGFREGAAPPAGQ